MTNEPSVTLISFKRDYIKFLRYIDPRKSPHTVRAYKSTLVSYFKYIEAHKLSPYSRNSVDEFLNDMNDTTHCSGRTLNRHLYAIRSMFKHARRFAELEDFESFNYDKVEQKEIPLSKLKSVLRHCHEDVDSLLIVLLITTGARISEIQPIRKKDIKFHANYLVLTITTMKKRKSTPTRNVPVKAEWAVDLIKKLVEKSPHKKLFKDITVNALQHKVRVIGERAKIKGLHPHNFRHTYISELARREVPIRIISKLVGHSSITTTEGYLHIHDDEILDKVVGL